MSLCYLIRIESQSEESRLRPELIHQQMVQKSDKSRTKDCYTYELPPRANRHVTFYAYENSVEDVVFTTEAITSWLATSRQNSLSLHLKEEVVRCPNSTEQNINCVASFFYELDTGLYSHDT